MMLEAVVVSAGNRPSQQSPMARRSRLLLDLVAPPRRADLSLQPFSHANQRAAGAGPRVLTLLTSLGTSSGEAFQIQVVNDGTQAVTLNGSGIVVEPLRAAVANRLRREIGQLAGRQPVTQRLDAYCVEFLRLPPSRGTIFRVASAEVQRTFAPMRRVMQTAYRLQRAGLLKPDSDPVAYFQSIKQWALWARERNFNAGSFSDAFVQHTRKNMEAAGRQWTAADETTVRGIIPGRWADISRILRVAELPTAQVR
jgi:hypothetical protein